jgi:hypothetical protein
VQYFSLICAALLPPGPEKTHLQNICTQHGGEHMYTTRAVQRPVFSGWRIATTIFACFCVRTGNICSVWGVMQRAKYGARAFFCSNSFATLDFEIGCWRGRVNRGRAGLTLLYRLDSNRGRALCADCIATFGLFLMRFFLSRQTRLCGRTKGRRGSFARSQGSEKKEHR